MSSLAPKPSTGVVRWRVLAAGVVFCTFALGGGSGWLLHDFTDGRPGSDTPVAAASTSAPVGVPDRAVKDACEGFAALGAQWSSGYHQWYAAVSSAGEGWTWATPAVKVATDQFFPEQTRIALTLRALAGPAVPEGVGKSIVDYSAALLAFAAAQNTNLPSSEIATRVDRINAAADQVIAACTR